VSAVHASLAIRFEGFACLTVKRSLSATLGSVPQSIHL